MKKEILGLISPINQTKHKLSFVEETVIFVMHVIIVLVSIMFLSCQGSIISQNNQKGTMGALYGKIRIEVYGEKINPVSVYLEENDISIDVNSNGSFYLPNLPPGSYRLHLKTNSFNNSLKNIYFEGIDIAQDSISLLMENIIYSDKDKYKWIGIKIKMVDIQDRGEIVGKIKDAINGTAVRQAFISISGTSWATESDSSGCFRIPDIISGEYNLQINKIGYHVMKISSLVIKADKSAIANILLVNSGIPEDSPIQKWVPQYK
jgi:hypothetical protein